MVSAALLPPWKLVLMLFLPLPRLLFPLLWERRKASSKWCCYIYS
jgi:hypothetical protein